MQCAIARGLCGRLEAKDNIRCILKCRNITRILKTIPPSELLLEIPYQHLCIWFQKEGS
jgi:hypothetical protein